MEIDQPKASLSDQKVTIIQLPSGVFRLCDRDGYVVAHGNNPRELSQYAFGIGAYEVRHDYNLSQYEENLRR